MTWLLIFIVWNISPVLFKIPGTPVALRWYGLMWAIGLIVSRQAGLYIFLKEKRYTENLPNLFLLIVIPAFIGARLGHFLFYDYWRMMLNPLAVILPPYYGMSSHGGVLGILIGVYIWCRNNKADYLFVIDRLAIVACSAGACIRIGNLMNSEVIGVPTEVPWAFIFKRVDLIPRHPAQLYEALFYLFIFFLLFYIWKKYSSVLKDGTLFGIVLASLWVFRFLIESLKETESSIDNAASFNIGQILSIPFILLGIFLILRNNRKSI